MKITPVIADVVPRGSWRFHGTESADLVLGSHTPYRRVWEPGTENQGEISGSEAGTRNRVPSRSEQRRREKESLRAKVRALIEHLKRDPCADCGRFYPPICMDFDHLPGTKKIGTVSQLAKKSFKAVKAEILKCEVVCSNCHRIRTLVRGQHGGAL